MHYYYYVYVGTVSTSITTHLTLPSSHPPSPPRPSAQAHSMPPTTATLVSAARLVHSALLLCCSMPPDPPPTNSHKPLGAPYLDSETAVDRQQLGDKQAEQGGGGAYIHIHEAESSA